MKQSDLNHLRRLLGWVRCDIGQDPAGQQQTMIDIAGKLGIDSIDADAKARLVEGYRRAEAVPVYVRDAVKALEKALAAVGRDPGVVAPLASADDLHNAALEACRLVVERFGPTEQDYIFSKRMAIQKCRAVHAAAQAEQGERQWAS